ncbi:hypothetical protein E2562_020613 [Oryza meyeriana var. granulata]|uniref:J domain-containing protein n=1 Tax=Oryza meyeriana var. granulata TaxID=110450 RepID=A0A6G1DYK9_9ORYZ|nr:hypothetical protein E2562_020613 [Oryza meyeriana var. granulata]
MAGDDDHYRKLGIGRDASKAEVKIAFCRLAQLHHPDRHAISDAAARDAAASRFRRVYDAYRVLYDDTARAASGGYGHGGGGAASSSSSGRAGYGHTRSGAGASSSSSSGGYSGYGYTHDGATGSSSSSYNYYSYSSRRRGGATSGWSSYGYGYGRCSGLSRPTPPSMSLPMFFVFWLPSAMG